MLLRLGLALHVCALVLCGETAETPSHLQGQRELVRQFLDARACVASVSASAGDPSPLAAWRREQTAAAARATRAGNATALRCAPRVRVRPVRDDARARRAVRAHGGGRARAAARRARALLLPRGDRSPLPGGRAMAAAAPIVRDALANVDASSARARARARATRTGCWGSRTRA